MARRLVLILLLVCTMSLAQDGANEAKLFFGLFNWATNSSKPTTDSTCNCDCGQKGDEGRIVGGEEASIYPWMARLSYYNRFYCGGTLINDIYVVTAAHCVQGFMWYLIKVTFGEHDRCRFVKRPETRFVVRTTIANFNQNNFINDIALLQLNDRVPITSQIRPICLPRNTDETYVNKIATVTGWGTTKEDGPTTCVLQQVDVPVISNEDCRNSKYSDSFIAENVLCAGYDRGQKDACKGDSGGPLIFKREDNKYELIGVVSWGNGCARPGYPGVYTRITKYVDWIRNRTKGACFCKES